MLGVGTCAQREEVENIQMENETLFNRVQELEAIATAQVCTACTD